jgi:flagellar hook-associated protein 1 FlgK
LAGLSTALTIASEALQASQAEISVTSNNIANANTPGYAREIVNLSEVAPAQDGSLPVGGGVNVESFSSVRDELLNLQIQQQTSEQSSADAQTSALQQLQTLFPTSGAGLGTDLSAFFSAISGLTATSAGTASRQAVISAGQNLADEFNSISNGLTTQQSSLNKQVVSDIGQINQLSSQIAGLNTQLVQLSGGGQDTSAIQDQIDAAQLQLAKLTNISVVTQTDGTDSITTGNGTPLVLGGQSFALSTSLNASGIEQISDYSGNNVTASITSGDLGGAILTRDTQIPSLLTQLDTLANQFATAINAAQAQGYNQNGTTGTALFTVPTTVSGSAALISFATTDPAEIAASSDGSSGSTGNVANLSAVATTALGSGYSPTNTISNLVYQVGSLTSDASANSTAIGVSLTQLTQQQSSVSGVSTDQEAANLIRYQQSYQAAAQIVNTVSTLFTATINMLSSAG